MDNKRLTQIEKEEVLDIIRLRWGNNNHNKRNYRQEKELQR